MAVLQPKRAAAVLALAGIAIALECLRRHRTRPPKHPSDGSPPPMADAAAARDEEPTPEAGTNEGTIGSPDGGSVAVGQAGTAGTAGSASEPPSSVARRSRPDACSARAAAACRWIFQSQSQSQSRTSDDVRRKQLTPLD